MSIHRGTARRLFILGAVTALVLAACGGNDADSSTTESTSGGRAVDVVSSPSGCTPTALQVTAGEQLVLNVKNTSAAERTVEIGTGSKTERLVIPSGGTKSMSHRVPASGDLGSLTCAADGAVATQIALQAAGAAQSTPASGGGETQPGY